MSLILEALRKLERDKPAPDRGVVVMTAAGLARDQRAPSSWAWLLAGVVAGLALAATAAVWLRPGAPPRPAPEAAAPVASALPTQETVTGTRAPQATLAPRRPPVPARASAAPAPPPPAAAPGAAPEADAPRAIRPALVLQAITVQEGRPVALINDRVLRVGDEVEGVRIVRIGEDEVEVEANGVRTLLRF